MTSSENNSNNNNNENDRRKRARPTADSTALPSALARLIARQQQKERELQKSLELLSLEPEMNEDIDDIDSPIFNEACASKANVRLLTNFFPNEIIEIESLLVFDRNPTKGPPRKISDLDSLFLLLVMLKSNIPHAQLAGMYRVVPQTLEKSFERTRVALYNCLKARHQVPRPVPLPPPCTEVALLTDTTFFRIPKPGRGLEDGTIYWNGHKRCYCLKKEVAVLAQPPYSAAFWSNSYNGGSSDGAIHDREADIFRDYLKQSLEEQAAIGAAASGTWKILGDAAYLHGALSRPDVQYVNRPSLVHGPEEERLNVIKSMQRVHVERFFGRLKGLWAICREVCHYDHVKFNLYVDICILLTNWHIMLHELARNDGDAQRMFNMQPLVEARERKALNRRKYLARRDVLSRRAEMQ